MNLFNKFLIKTANAIYPFKIFGLENIPESNCVICSNHLSIIDVTYIVKLFNKNTYFVAKKEVMKGKFVRKLLASFGGIPIDRDNVDIRSLMNFIKLLKNGNNLVIFPEGTRNKTGSTDMLPFKGGSMLFAVKSKKAILPLVVYKKARLFRKNFLMIGKPFELSDFYDKQMTEDVISVLEKQVRDRMVELQKELFDRVDSLKKKKGKKK
jgi:1-acyl-sn-glycerol-3-phosphate acyltransferase